MIKSTFRKDDCGEVGHWVEGPRVEAETNRGSWGSPDKGPRGGLREGRGIGDGGKWGNGETLRRKRGRCL